MKPILFNTEMVRAILDGRKTVTRRLIKPQPEFREGETGTPERCADGNWCFKIDQYTSIYDFDIKPPYHPGDILYVRETWGVYCRNWWEAGYFNYKADWQAQESPYGPTEPPKWRPSIHMPKEAARIFLRVKSVRVQRLRDMVLADVLMEGIKEGDSYEETWDRWHKTWDSTVPKNPNKFKSYPYYWKDNPWVWVISFERCEKPEEVPGC